MIGVQVKLGQMVIKTGIELRAFAHWLTAIDGRGLPFVNVRRNDSTLLLSGHVRDN